jgi:hypothetical protein
MRIEGLPEDAKVETLDGLPVRRVPTSDKPDARLTDKVEISNNEPPGALRIRTADGAERLVRAERFVGSGWIVLDLILGVFPLIVDGGSGAWFEYHDTTFKAGKPVAPTAAAANVKTAPPPAGPAAPAPAAPAP